MDEAGDTMSAKSEWIKLEMDEISGGLRHPFPEICCQCLAPTNSKYRLIFRTFRGRFGPRFQIPFCGECQLYLDQKRSAAGAFLLLVLAIVAGLYRLFTGHWDFAWIVFLVGLFIVLALFVMVPAIEPVCWTARNIHFRNRAFVDLWKQTWSKPMDFILPQEWQKRK